MPDLTNMYALQAKLVATTGRRIEDRIPALIDFLSECHDRAHEVDDPTLLAATGAALEGLRAARTPREVAAAIDAADRLSRLLDCEGSA